MPDTTNPSTSRIGSTVGITPYSMVPMTITMSRYFVTITYLSIETGSAINKFCFIMSNHGGGIYFSTCIQNRELYGSYNRLINSNNFGVKYFSQNQDQNIELIASFSTFGTNIIFFNNNGVYGTYLMKTPDGFTMQVHLLRSQMIYNGYSVDVYKVLQTSSTVYLGKWIMQMRIGSTIYYVGMITNTNNTDTKIYTPILTYMPPQYNSFITYGSLIALRVDSGGLSFPAIFYYYFYTGTPIFQWGTIYNYNNFDWTTAKLSSYQLNCYLSFQTLSGILKLLVFSYNDGNLISIISFGGTYSNFYYLYDYSGFYATYFSSNIFFKALFDTNNPTKTCLDITPSSESLVSTSPLTMYYQALPFSSFAYDNTLSYQVVYLSYVNSFSTQIQMPQVDCSKIVLNGTSPILAISTTSDPYNDINSIASLIQTNYILKCQYSNLNNSLFGYSLSSSVKLQSNSSVVSWATINISTQKLSVSGIPVNLKNTTFNLLATYSDSGSGKSIDAVIQFTSIVPNLPPVVAVSVTNKTYVAGSYQIIYSVSGFFSDPEGRTLTLSSNQINGSSLPSYIIFNGTDFITTPNNLGVTSIRLYCTDDKPNIVYQDFNITIINNNPTNITTIPSDTVYDNVTYTKTVNLSQVFNDPDSSYQTITYSVISVPSFLTYSIVGSTLTINGTPSVSDVGSYNVFARAFDSFAYGISMFKIIVQLNDPPTAPTISDINCLEMQTKVITIPSFTDPEGDPVYYSMVFINGSALDSNWITFSTSTRQLNILPLITIKSHEQVVVSATDNMNPPTSVTINIYTDFKPKINSAVTTLSGKFICKQTSTFSISSNLFTDEDSTLNYSLTYSNGSTIDSWMNMILPSNSLSGDFEFTGNYPNFTTLTLSFILTAKDSKTQSSSVTITILISAVCNSVCKTCTGPSIDECTSCNTGRFLYLTLCKTTCPDGYYNQINTNTCGQCDVSCQTCTGPTSTDCINCKNNITTIYYRFNDYCTLNCPTGYANIVYNQSCVLCHEYCKDCYGVKSTECTSCKIENRYTLVYPDTCVYLECPSLTYYDSINYICKDCNNLCKNCYGPKSDNCIDCPYSRFLASDNSCKTCQEINSGLNFEPLMNTCIERCGKGFNLGFLECDDGNLINDDGCSSLCKVELNFRCFGGSPTTKDTCKSTIGPSCEFSTISSSNHLGTIALSEQAVFGKYRTSDISITITGPLQPYDFKYTIDNSTGFIEGDVGNKFRIQFEFLSTLAGYNQETITVKFNNRKILKDLDDNNLETEFVVKQIPFFLVVVSEADKAQAGQNSILSIISLILTFATSIFISVVLGGTIEATWLLLGTLQMMSLIPLFDLNLPGNFREFAVNLAVLNGEPQFFPNIFENFIDTSKLKPFSPYFELMNFKTNLFLMNAGRKVMIWIVLIIMMGVTFILFDLCSELNKIGSCVRKIDYKIRYGMLIRGVTQSYLSLTLSVILNVYTISWSGPNLSYTNNIVAIVGALIIGYIPVKTFETIVRTHNLNDPDFQIRYKTIIVDLRTDDPLRFHFTTVFFFRRVLYACVFVLLSFSSYAQIFGGCCTIIMMFIYIIIIRPYASFLSMLLSVTNELLLLPMIAISGRFINPIIAPSDSKTIGLVMMSLLIFTIFINWLCIIIKGIHDFIVKKLTAKKIKRLKEIKCETENSQTIANETKKSIVKEKPIKMKKKRNQRHMLTLRHSDFGNIKISTIKS